MGFTGAASDAPDMWAIPRHYLNLSVTVYLRELSTQIRTKEKGTDKEPGPTLESVNYADGMQ